MSNTVELKYAIPIVENGEKREVKFLKAGRLKVKHFELLPASILDQAMDNEGKLTLEKNNMITMFKELIPFIAGIFDIPIESAKEIDFDDIENVVGCLEHIMPEDSEKKN
jgi:hypothetical protein